MDGNNVWTGSVNLCTHSSSGSLPCTLGLRGEEEGTVSSLEEEELTSADVPHFHGKYPNRWDV